MMPLTILASLHLIGLLYFLARQEKISATSAFRTAWIWFAALPLSHVVFNLFRLANSRSPRDLAVIEIWADTAQWFCLGLSLIFLATAIIPKNPVPRVQ